MDHRPKAQGRSAGVSVPSSPSPRGPRRHHRAGQRRHQRQLPEIVAGTWSAAGSSQRSGESITAAESTATLATRWATLVAATRVPTRNVLFFQNATLPRTTRCSSRRSGISATRSSWTTDARHARPGVHLPRTAARRARARRAAADRRQIQRDRQQDHQDAGLGTKPSRSHRSVEAVLACPPSLRASSGMSLSTTVCSKTTSGTERKQSRLAALSMAGRDRILA